MEIISKQFDTLKQAEDHQNLLYEQYEKVVMVTFPRFTEGGLYQWKVSNEKN